MGLFAAIPIGNTGQCPVSATCIPELGQTLPEYGHSEVEAEIRGCGCRGSQAMGRHAGKPVPCLGEKRNLTPLKASGRRPLLAPRRGSGCCSQVVVTELLFPSAQRYDRTKLSLKEIRNVQYVSCMNPTAGSFTINPRLQVHVSGLVVGWVI